MKRWESFPMVRWDLWEREKWLTKKGLKNISKHIKNESVTFFQKERSMLCLFEDPSLYSPLHQTFFYLELGPSILTTSFLLPSPISPWVSPVGSLKTFVNICYCFTTFIARIVHSGTIIMVLFLAFLLFFCDYILSSLLLLLRLLYGYDITPMP